MAGTEKQSFCLQHRQCNLLKLSPVTNSAMGYHFIDGIQQALSHTQVTSIIEIKKNPIKCICKYRSFSCTAQILNQTFHSLRFFTCFFFSSISSRYFFYVGIVTILQKWQSFFNGTSSITWFIIFCRKNMCKQFF